MKNQFFALCLALGLLGCQEQPDQHALPGTALNDLHLVNARPILPSLLLSSVSKAVFVNAAGAEKSLDVRYEEGTRIDQFQSFRYSTEFMEVQYADPDDPDYQPGILARAEYDDIRHSHEYVRIHVDHVAQKEFTPTLILCPPQQECAYLERTFESITLNDRVFQQVFASYYPPPQIHSYSEVYYSLEQGIIAFVGEGGVMWVLDRFEE
jgi:hypothetical protein